MLAMALENASDLPYEGSHSSTNTLSTPATPATSRRIRRTAPEPAVDTSSGVGTLYIYYSFFVYNHLLTFTSSRKFPLCLRAFDARITVFFRDEVGWSCPPDTGQFNRHVRRLGPKDVLDLVERPRTRLFNEDAQRTTADTDNGSSHVKFLQQMEVYKTFKKAIRVADIGAIR